VASVDRRHGTQVPYGDGTETEGGIYWLARLEKGSNQDRRVKGASARDRIAPDLPSCRVEKVRPRRRRYECDGISRSELRKAAIGTWPSAAD
jgi:hypothetical protein